MSTEQFIPTFGKCDYDSIILKIQEGDYDYILNNLCYINGETLVLDYEYFQHFANFDNYDMIISDIIEKIDIILSMHNKFVVYGNLNNLSLFEVFKHLYYIEKLSIILVDKYPYLLKKCYLCNVPCIFPLLLSIIKPFIDNGTDEKIILI